MTEKEYVKRYNELSDIFYDTTQKGLITLNQFWLSLQDFCSSYSHYIHGHLDVANQRLINIEKRLYKAIS